MGKHSDAACAVIAAGCAEDEDKAIIAGIESRHRRAEQRPATTLMLSGAHFAMKPPFAAPARHDAENFAR